MLCLSEFNSYFSHGLDGLKMEVVKKAVADYVGRKKK